MERRKATWSNFTISINAILTLLLPFILPYGYFLSFIILLLIIHQILLRLIFQSPSKRSLILSQQGWDILKVENLDSNAYAFVNISEQKSDLVVFVHGWQSSSEKFFERIQIFHNEGLHTMAIDMRGHGISPDTPEWTAGKVISDVKSLLNEIDNSLIDKVHFYGHSLGGFVCLGMHHARHEGWWKDKYGTLMLESPMAAYSPILEEMSGRLSFMLPLLKKWALQGFNKIHPEVGGIEWKDIDVPHWGLPKVPTLLLQATNDKRLGRFHYDLLRSQEIDLQSHLIDSLGHSNNRVNSERDRLIKKWIDDMII